MTCIRSFKNNNFKKNELDIAFSRTHQVDEYKYNVQATDLIDLQSFRPFVETGALHNQVQFILYSEEAMSQWNIGNYVYPHKDGAKELDPFHVSLVAPIENYEHSMIRWFSGCDDESQFETLRTGRFLKKFSEYKKCKLVDTYIFKDDTPVLFRVDVWHDVLIPFPGRKIMRWLFKPNYKWESAINLLSDQLNP